MEKFLLLVDDQGRIESVLERALKGTQLKVVSFTDVASAKRSLIQSRPSLIVTAVSFQDDPNGGFRLSSEVANHADLAKIPLVIVTEELSEDVIHRATESGAKSLIPWPITSDSLRNRLKTFFSEELETPDTASSKASSFETSAASGAQVSQPSPSVSAPGEKIKVAQHLLAKVLHNLKTSDLLEVIDLEDVPRVVFEITRAVCDVKAAPPKPTGVPKAIAAPKPAEAPRAGEASAPVKSTATPQQRSLSPDVELDLDAAFNLKK